jgi:prevent-host-death family protein
MRIMEVGIRDAKNNLSKLIEAVLEGQEVFLTNRGSRVVQLVIAPQPSRLNKGRGAWKGKVNLYPGWESAEEDKKIEDAFEALHESKP